MKTDHIKVGDVVRLKRRVASKGGVRAKTRVEKLLSGIEGGVLLESPLDDFRCWNIRDLELVKDK